MSNTSPPDPRFDFSKYKQAAFSIDDLKAQGDFLFKGNAPGTLGLITIAIKLAAIAIYDWLWERIYARDQALNKAEYESSEHAGNAGEIAQDPNANK